MRDHHSETRRKASKRSVAAGKRNGAAVPLPALDVRRKERIEREIDRVVAERKAARKGRRKRGGRAVRDERSVSPPGPPLAADAPFWLAARYERLSSGLKTAVAEILVPAYRRLVLNAAEGVEQTIGMSLVHAMWMELCEQSALADVIAESDTVMALVNDREEKIGAHLKLVAAKAELAQLLGRLRAMRRFFEEDRDRRSLALPAPGAVEILPAAATGVVAEG